MDKMDAHKNTRNGDRRMIDLCLLDIISNHAFFDIRIGMFSICMFLDLLKHLFFSYSFRSKVTSLDYTAKLSWHTAC